MRIVPNERECAYKSIVAHNAYNHSTKTYYVQIEMRDDSMQTMCSLCVCATLPTSSCGRLASIAHLVCTLASRNIKRGRCVCLAQQPRRKHRWGDILVFGFKFNRAWTTECGCGKADRSIVRRAVV